MDHIYFISGQKIVLIELGLRQFQWPHITSSLRAKGTQPSSFYTMVYVWKGVELVSLIYEDDTTYVFFIILFELLGS